MKTITIATEHTSQLVDITNHVKDQVVKSGIKEGICTVFTPHTTGSVILFENVDPHLRRDLLRSLKAYLPSNGTSSHVGGNAAAHLKSAFMGSTLSIPVINGAPILGQWQGIFFCEFDGPREARNIMVKVING